MARLKLTPWDVKGLLKRIDFSSRICSDGQCCSFELDEFSPATGFKSDKFYWILEYKRYLRAYTHYIFRIACPELEISFNINEGNLILEASCRIYEERYPQCKEWGTELKCNYREYVEEIERDQFYSSLFILVLSRKDYIRRYPYLSEFDLMKDYPDLNTPLIKRYVPEGICIPLPAKRRILPTLNIKGADQKVHNR